MASTGNRRNRLFGGSGAKNSLSSSYVRADHKRQPIFKPKEINHYIGKRMSQEELEQYLSKDSLQCLECGNHYKNLSLHLFYSHSLTKKDYCLKYGLPLSTPFVGQQIREDSSNKQQLGLIKPTIENLKIAIEERERIKAQCDKEILELKELCREYKEAFDSGFNNPQSFKLVKGARINDNDLLYQTILSAFENAKELSITEAYEIVNNIFPVKVPTFRDRIEKLFKKGIIEKSDPNSQRNIKYKLSNNMGV